MTAGSLIGFVAFAGGVIVWTRFAAAKVPPDQAVNAVPRGELVSIGASILLLFGFFGALALLAMFLVDRGGRATPGMSRGLLCLLMIEGTAAIMLAVDRPIWQRAIAATSFILPLGLAVAATFADKFVRLEDKLPARTDESLKPKRVRAPLRESELMEWVERDGYARRLRRLNHYKRRLFSAVVLAALVAFLMVDRSEAVRIGIGSLLVVLIVGFLAGRVLREVDKTRETVQKEAKASQVEGEREVERLKKRRPYRLSLEPLGMTLLTALMAVALIGPSLVLGKLWLAGSLAAAMLVALGLWRIAALSKAAFMWYGLAVFISVPLFGTLTAMAHNLDDPQAQPMALIRNTDGADEAIQGLYVTETDDRVYFATLSTEGCGSDIVEHSGRLLWVPKSEVVAISIGPLEDVTDARTTALEMAYALTPAVETPAGDHVSLTAGEKRAKAAAPKPESSQDQRLENVGAAVRPDFGIGLRLVPEDASRGDIVTLRMSSPNTNVKGFGQAREGRTLRLGGVPVSILRESVHSAGEAEFVKTTEGKVLALDKEGVYVRNSDDGIVPLDKDPTNRGKRFVRLGDYSGVEEPRIKGKYPGVYLEVEKGYARLAEGQKVRFAKGDPVLIELRLLRQAWHENHIKFRVPDNASTGVVSVECEQLAGQPLLRVARPPVARIAVRMTPGSPHVVFDSHRSSDGNRRIVSRRWTIEGLRRAHGDQIVADMPARPDDYAVGLTVTDAKGQADTAWLHVLRLPANLMRFEEGRSEHPKAMQRARGDLLGVVSRDSPVAVEFDAVVDGESPPGAGLILKGAEAMRDSLLQAKTGSPVDPDLTVRTLAYDRACPFQAGEGSGGGVDIVALSGGVQVAPPRLCPPDRVRIAHGWPPPQR